MPDKQILYPDSARSRRLYGAQLRAVEALELGQVRGPQGARSDFVPVPMPCARFRREFFGAVAVQPITQQLTNLSPSDCSVIESVDGVRTAAEIERKIGVADVQETFARLVRSGLFRWSTCRIAGRQVRFEQYEDEPRTTERLSSPLMVIWEPTLRCNLSCGFCHNESGPMGRLDTALMARIADKFCEAGVFRVSIAGGEPTILPNFFDLVARFEASGAEVEFTTNGLRITDKFMERVEQTRIVELMVSIQGNEYHHDRLVGRKGAFQKAMAAVRSFAAAGYKVTVGVILTRANAATLVELIDIAAKAGAPRLRVSPVVTRGRAALAGFNDVSLNDDDIVALAPMLAAKAKEYAQQMEIGLKYHTAALGSCGCNDCPIDPDSLRKQGATCAIGRRNCYVRADGGVAPTTFLRDVVLGSLLNDSLLTIWQDDEQWHAVRPCLGNPLGLALGNRW